MKSTVLGIFISAMALFSGCSRRDEAHIVGCMSDNEQLQAVHAYYSPYKEGTYDKAWQMLCEIDTLALPERDYYEWLELKSNIAEAGEKSCAWLEDLERWVAYADAYGSDRDILAAHLHLSLGYYRWDYRIYGNHGNVYTPIEADSVRNLCLQEALFCICYKDDEPDYAPEGDYLLLKARAYSHLAKLYWNRYCLNYSKTAHYTHEAALVLQRYLKQFPRCAYRREISRQMKDLFCDAALLYRNCMEERMATECAFALMSIAIEEESQEDLCRGKALMGSIGVAYHFNSGQYDRYHVQYPSIMRDRVADAMPLLDESINEYPEGKTPPAEFYHYKAMAFRLMDQYDSAYYYDRKAGTLTSEETVKESLVISALYKEQHGDKAGALADLKEAISKLERTKNRLAQSHKPVPEALARQRSQSVIEMHRAQYRRNLMCLSGIFVVLLCAVVWFATRKQRKLRQMRSDIEALNQQLDRLRADQLQKQVTADSLEAEPMDDRMEEIFCRKLQVQKAAFATTSHYSTIMQYNMRASSTCNPDAAIIPTEERRRLMDAILANFSLECQQLRELCPDLTGADAVYCILHLLDCGRDLGACCMEVSQEAFRRRKSRLKSKLSERLFNLFFGGQSPCSGEKRVESKE